MPQATATDIVNAFLSDDMTTSDFNNLLPYIGRQKVASCSDLLAMLSMLLHADAVNEAGQAVLHACLDYLEPLPVSAMPIAA